MALHMTRADRVLSTPPTNTPIDTNRRHFLSVAAGGVAAAIPNAALTAASAVDPVFELIEAHRAAHATHLAAIDEANRLEELHGDDWGSMTEKPCHDENAAFDSLVGATATTPAGLLAKLAPSRDRGGQGSLDAR